MGTGQKTETETRPCNLSHSPVQHYASSTRETGLRLQATIRLPFAIKVSKAGAHAADF